MKKLWVVLPVLVISALMVMPTVVSADGLFEPLINEKCQCPTSAPDWGCALETVQNGMNLAIALGIVIATLVIAYAGAIWMASPLNPSNREKGRTMLLNAVVGLAIVLVAWLFVDFLMKAVYDPTKGQFGPWEDILVADDDKDYCIQANSQRSRNIGQATTSTGQIGVQPTPTATTTSPTASSTPSTATSTATSTPSTTSQNIAQRICAAANAYRGTSTANAPNTNNGRLACAWAVNEVLKDANLSPIGGSNVRGMESALRGGRGQTVTQGNAVCGDLVLVTGRTNHVGICLNSGCTSVISNSSSRASFSWTSGPEFAPSYNNPNYRIYRVLN